MRKNYKELCVYSFFVLLLIYVLINRRACVSQNAVMEGDTLLWTEYQIYVEIVPPTRDTNNLFISLSDQMEYIIEIWESNYQNVLPDGEFVASIADTALITGNTHYLNSDTSSDTFTVGTDGTTYEKKLIYYTRWEDNRGPIGSVNSLDSDMPNAYLRFGEIGQTISGTDASGVNEQRMAFYLGYVHDRATNDPDYFNVDAKLRVGRRLSMKITSIIVEGDGGDPDSKPSDPIKQSQPVPNTTTVSHPQTPVIKSFSILADGVEMIGEDETVNTITTTVTRTETGLYYSGLLSNATDLMDGSINRSTVKKLENIYYEDSNPPENEPYLDTRKKLLTGVNSIASTSADSRVDGLGNSAYRAIFTSQSGEFSRAGVGTIPGDTGICPIYQVSVEYWSDELLPDNVLGNPVNETNTLNQGLRVNGRPTNRIYVLDISQYLNTTYDIGETPPFKAGTPEGIKKLLGPAFDALADDAVGGIFLCKKMWVTKWWTGFDNRGKMYLQWFRLQQQESNIIHDGTSKSLTANRTRYNGLDTNPFLPALHATDSHNSVTYKSNGDTNKKIFVGGYYDFSNDDGPWRTRYNEHYRFYNHAILLDIHKGYVYHKQYTMSSETPGA